MPYMSEFSPTRARGDGAMASYELLATEPARPMEFGLAEVRLVGI